MANGNLLHLTHHMVCSYKNNMRTALFILIVSALMVDNIQAQDFEKADSLAFAMPKRVHSKTALASEISTHELSDAEKVRLLYTWMANTIHYDLKSYEKAVKPPDETRYTLKTGRAVCTGYAHLFDSVCQLLSIPSFVVKGYVHQGFNPRASNHAWNAILVDGQWRFVDVSSGSGAVENVESFRWLKKLLRKPSIRDKNIWVRQVNHNYFLAGYKQIAASHMPADPMWQLQNHLYPLHCFTESQWPCQPSNGYFGYMDTLHNFLRLDPFDQQVATAHRALLFNSDNHMDLAGALAGKGQHHALLSENIVPHTSDKRAGELKQAVDAFGQAGYHLDKAKHIDDSIYKSELGELKTLFKTTSRHTRQHLKTAQKTIQNNKKFLVKVKKRQDAVGKSIKKYKDLSLRAATDNKLFILPRPKELADAEDSIQMRAMHRAVDSLVHLLKDGRDTLNYTLDSSFLHIFGSIRVLRQDLPQIVYDLDTLLAFFQAKYIMNQKGLLENEQTAIEGQYILYTGFATYKNMIDEILQTQLRERHQFVKDRFKYMEAVVKEAKRELTGLKKLNLVDQGEEGKYELLNQLLMSRYQKYMGQLNNENLFYETDQHEVKVLNRVLKGHIQQLKKVEKLEQAFYNHHIENLKYRHGVEKQQLYQYAKWVATEKNKGLKALNDIEAQKQKNRQ
jgi:hypothetical protein